jgi:hypothetical protein
MSQTTHAVLSTVLALTALTACTKHDASASSSAAASAPAGASASASSGNACDAKLITQQDVSDIFSVPITGEEPIPGDAQTCEFKAGGSSIQISVRPGLGHESVQEWVDGKVAVEASPLAGVGDRAMWQPQMHEVMAGKNNLLCDISAMGLGGVLKDPSPAVMQKKIGALCNKIFAAQ